MHLSEPAPEVRLPAVEPTGVEPAPSTPRHLRGSRFYYSLIWVIALSTVLMLAFADVSIRVGIMSRGSVVETIKETLGRATGVAAGLGVFTITLMFSVGNAVGTGLGLSLVLGGVFGFLRERRQSSRYRHRHDQSENDYLS